MTQRLHLGPSFLRWVVLPFFLCHLLMYSQPSVVHRIYPDYVPQALPHTMGNAYDDAVTLQAIAAFEEEGASRTMLFGNRRGLPSVSMFDIHEDQCKTPAAASAQGVAPESPRAVNYLGVPIHLQSLNQDCVYTHYPSFTILVYWFVSQLGFDLFGMRMLSLLLTCMTLMHAFLFTQRLTSPRAAFLATSILACSPSIFLWSTSLFYQNIQLYLVMFIIDTAHRYARSKPWLGRSMVPKRILVAYFFLCLSSPEYVLFVPVYLFLVHGLSQRSKIRRLVTNGLLLAAAGGTYLALHILQSLLFYGSIEALWDHWSVTLRNRALSFHVDATFNDPKTVILQLLPRLINTEVLPWWAILFFMLSILLIGIRPHRNSFRLWITDRFKFIVSMALSSLMFPLMFPHTAFRHHWVLYRQIDFAVVTLVAVGLFCISTLRRYRKDSRMFQLTIASIPILIGGLVLAGFLRVFAAQGLYFVRASAIIDRDNAMAYALDFTAWDENFSGQAWLGSVRGAPLDGLAYSPGSPTQGLSLQGKSRFLVVFRKQMPIRTIRINTDHPAVLERDFLSSCEFQGFDGMDLDPLSIRAVRQAASVSGENWVVFELDQVQRVKGILVRCHQGPPILIFEMDVAIDQQ